MAFIEKTEGRLVYHTSTVLEGVSHAFSTRKGGVSRAPWDTLNLGVGRNDDPEDVKKNYEIFFAPLSLDPRRAVLSKQVHEDTVRLVTSADAGKGLFLPRDYTADALITKEPGLPLVVFSADCNIMLFYDPVQKAIGAAHAGWRGTALQIAGKTVREMVRNFGSRPEDLRVAIGAGIGPCCFETHDDVPDAMRDSFGKEAEPYLTPLGEKWNVDLKGLNALSLKKEGVTQVDICPLCTACRLDLYWSHRKTGSARGAQVAVISL